MGALTRLETGVILTAALLPVVLVILTDRSKPYRTGRLRAVLVCLWQRVWVRAVGQRVHGRWS